MMMLGLQRMMGHVPGIRFRMPAQNFGRRTEHYGTIALGSGDEGCATVVGPVRLFGGGRSGLYPAKSGRLGREVKRSATAASARVGGQQGVGSEKRRGQKEEVPGHQNTMVSSRQGEGRMRWSKALMSPGLPLGPCLFCAADEEQSGPTRRRLRDERRMRSKKPRLPLGSGGWLWIEGCALRRMAAAVVGPEGQGDALVALLRLRGLGWGARD